MLMAELANVFWQHPIARRHELSVLAPIDTAAAHRTT